MVKRTRKIDVTEQVFDIIETGRNLRKSYPDGDPQIRYYLERLITNWLDGEEY
ncbi:MAG: hypothetical protein ACI3Y0_06020 [Prevotella sp.]